MTAKENIESVKSLLNQPIALIGMMGAGKSFLGKALANSLSLDFVDSDELIETRAGITTSEIFEHYGEEKFRDTERRVIEEVCQRGVVVLSTGGGAPTNAQTWETLKSQYLCVWLNADLELMWSRVSKSQTRPLLKTADPKGTLKNLLDDRKPLYQQAHIEVKINARNARTAEKRIIKALYEYLNTDNV